MSAIVRPGTPFPHTSPAPPTLTSRRSSQPLHFALPMLPSRTPPSLLKRSASSSSSGSASGYYKHSRSGSSTTDHSLSQRRESASSSTSSSSSSSSPRISTPRLYAADDDVEILLQDQIIPPPSVSPLILSTSASMPKQSQLSTPSRPRLLRGQAVPLPPKTTTTRPKFHRRDTPRPVTDVLEFTIEKQGPKRQGSYTSVIDGGKWEVVL